MTVPGPSTTIKDVSILTDGRVSLPIETRRLAAKDTPTCAARIYDPSTTCATGALRAR